MLRYMHGQLELSIILQNLMAMGLVLEINWSLVSRTTNSSPNKDRIPHHRHSIFENLQYFFYLVRDVFLDAMYLFDFGLLERISIFRKECSTISCALNILFPMLLSLLLFYTNLMLLLSLWILFFFTGRFSSQSWPIKELACWKLAEFRQVLLYTGVVILKKYLSSACL